MLVNSLDQFNHIIYLRREGGREQLFAITDSKTSLHHRPVQQGPMGHGDSVLYHEALHTVDHSMMSLTRLGSVLADLPHIYTANGQERVSEAEMEALLDPVISI